MLPAYDSSTNKALAKGWGILSQLIYPPLLGFAIGWLIEKKWPAQGFWMLGLLLLFFFVGMYGIIKAYLLELSAEEAKTQAQATPVPTTEPDQALNQP